MDPPTPLLFVAHPARSAGKVLKVSGVFSMSWFPGFLQPWFTGTPVLAWDLLGVQDAHATQESCSLVLRAQSLDQAVVQNNELEGCTSNSEKVFRL